MGCRDDEAAASMSVDEGRTSKSSDSHDHRDYVVRGSDSTSGSPISPMAHSRASSIGSDIQSLTAGSIGSPYNASVRSSLSRTTSYAGESHHRRSSRRHGKSTSDSHDIQRVLALYGTGAQLQQRSLPTSRDIAAVTLSPVPEVAISDFDHYLAALKEQPPRTQHRAPRASSMIGDESGYETPKGKTRSDRTFSIPSVVSQQSPSMRLPQSRTPSRRLPSTSESAEDLVGSIPLVFFEEGFSLQNPRTFEIVSENSEIVQHPSASVNSKRALTSNALLQEKLTWYMDIVEVQLVKEIHEASSNVFGTLDDLQALGRDSERTVAKIRITRENFKELNELQRTTGLGVAHLQTRLDNMKKLHSLVRRISHLEIMREDVELKLTQRDFPQALDSIDKLRKAIHNMSSARKLPQVVNEMGGALDENLNQIVQAQVNEFIDLLMSDIRLTLKSVQPEVLFAKSVHQVTKPGKEQTEESALHQIPSIIQDKLHDTMAILRRLNEVSAAFITYKQIIKKEARDILKRQLPSDSDADSSVSNLSAKSRTTAEKSANLARALRQMSPEVFVDMMQTIYFSLLEYFKHIRQQEKLLLNETARATAVQDNQPDSSQDVNNSGANNSGAFGPRGHRAVSESTQATVQLSDLVASAVDVSQSRLIKILSVRADANVTDLSPEHFSKYYIMSRIFLSECEKISGRLERALANLYNVQARKFISQRYERGSQHLSDVLDRDQWKTLEEVPADVQRAVDCITLSALEDPLLWTQVATFSKTKSDEKPSSVLKLLKIGDEKFFVVRPVVELVCFLEEWSQFVLSIPGHLQDIGNCLSEIYKLFNLRCNQLILAAGATRTGSLKRILAKHLTFSSQTLSVLMSLIQSTREYLRRHICPSNILIEMDNTRKVLKIIRIVLLISQDIQIHQTNIHNKLVSIMVDRLNAHTRAFATMDWSEVDEPKRHPYTDVIVNETTLLCNVVVRYLPPITHEVNP